MEKRIVIIDYGMGNLRSVEKAFESCGAKVCVTSSVREIEKARKIVLPGVGAFAHAMQELKKRKLIPTLKEKIQAGTPYLGLCLGMQLLFSSSEEGNVKGLDILPGEVKHFKGALKVPHMGWNTLNIKHRCPSFDGVKPQDYFYFVHSYYGRPNEREWNAASTHYGVEFTSAVWKGNVFATQFHPEKSQAAGLRVIKNFIDYNGR